MFILRTMEEDPEKPKKSNTTLMVVLLVMLPVLYVLSIGPATKFVILKSSADNSEIVLNSSFYAPLLWLIYEAPWLRKPLSNYVNYWQNL